MAELITLPKMSDTMTEGVIVRWNVKVGDTVKSGDILAEVETDKATMDMEVYAKGTVLQLLVEEGNAIPVDGPIAIVGTPGEDFQALLSGNSAPKTASPAADAPATSSAPAVTNTPAVNTSSTTNDERLKASPLAKKIAAEKGIDLNAVVGSGENGRIVKKDLENTSAVPAAANVGILSLIHI
jgi:pyruvate dehydrogenase E2 component (dihydrolipoamide acetyltransferase)